MSWKQAFKGLSQDSLKVIGARASKTVLRIRCKFSLIYLGIAGIMAETIAIGRFAFKGSTGWSNNSSPNLGGREESKKATKERFLQE